MEKVSQSVPHCADMTHHVFCFSRFFLVFLVFRPWRSICMYGTVVRGSVENGVFLSH